MHEVTNVRPRWNLIASLSSLIGHLMSYSLISREHLSELIFFDTYEEKNVHILLILPFQDY